MYVWFTVDIFKHIQLCLQLQGAAPTAAKDEAPQAEAKDPPRGAVGGFKWCRSMVEAWLASLSQDTMAISTY